MNNEFKIELSQYYITGIPGIDTQHNEIFTMLDHLLDSLENEKSSRDDINTAIHDIFDKMRTHIATEESLMEMIDFPKAAEHKAQHDNLFNMLAEESKILNSRDNAKISRFLRSYQHIAITHISIFDREYVNHIEKFKATKSTFRKSLARGEAIAG